MKTELLRKLIDHFENLYLQSKDEAANAVALSLYSMSLFHTFYQGYKIKNYSIRFE
jgi:hypothetical protein